MPQVLLNYSISKLGSKGEIVFVKPGYAHNHLIPKGLAQLATKSAIVDFESRSSDIRAENAKKFEFAAEASKTMVQTICIPAEQNKSGNLYGSISDKEIYESLIALNPSLNGHIDHSQISVPKIRKHGVYKIPLELHKGIIVTLTVSVAQTIEEAQNQI